MVNSQPSSLNIKAENWPQKLLGSSQHVNCPEDIGMEGSAGTMQGLLHSWAATGQRAGEVRILYEECSVLPEW